MPIYLLKPLNAEIAAKPKPEEVPNPLIPQPPVIEEDKKPRSQQVSKRRPLRSPALAYA